MSELSDEACDRIAATIKAMLQHRPMERTTPALWRHAIRIGFAKTPEPLRVTSGPPSCAYMFCVNSVPSEGEFCAEHTLPAYK